MAWYVRPIFEYGVYLGILVTNVLTGQESAHETGMTHERNLDLVGVAIR